MKPQYLDSILDALKPHILPSHLIISIAAGIRVASLEAALPEGTRVVSSCSQKLLADCFICTVQRSPHEMLAHPLTCFLEVVVANSCGSCWYFAM